MTNPTLERAARAVSEAMASVPAKAMNNAEWIDFERKIARAVLMAVREPDELMIDAGKKDSPYVDQEDVGDIFTAMIDAILGESDDNA